MGLQIRKRTKGSKSWFNFSKSGVSHSSKIGNVTTTVGTRGTRMTVNLGNGVRYVKTRGWGTAGGRRQGFMVTLANAMIMCSGLIWLWHFGMQLYNSGMFK